MSVGKKGVRQSKLLSYLKESGYESLEQLATKLSVSEQTIRRDITELDQKKLARRTHGGVAFFGGLDSQDYLRRRFESKNTKQRIAQRVAEMVSDGDSIFLDAGTTCVAVAEALNVRENLKIVTYNLGAVIALKDRTDFTMAIPGGFIRHIDGSVIGDFSTDFIRRFHFDVAVISASGIDTDGTMGDDNHWEVANVRTVMELSARTVLALDSTKFYRAGLVPLGPISDVDALVTDTLPDGKLREILLQGTDTKISE